MSVSAVNRLLIIGFLESHKTFSFKKQYLNDNMSIIVRLSREHTISLPEDLIRKMHFATNDEIVVQVEEDKLVLSKKTASYTDKLRGLHKEVWEDVDTEQFLEKERQSWNKHA